jgi:hypothetical protein
VGTDTSRMENRLSIQVVDTAEADLIKQEKEIIKEEKVEEIKVEEGNNTLNNYICIFILCNIIRAKNMVKPEL